MTGHPMYAAPSYRIADHPSTCAHRRVKNGCCVDCGLALAVIAAADTYGRHHRHIDVGHTAAIGVMLRNAGRTRAGQHRPHVDAVHPCGVQTRLLDGRFVNPQGHVIVGGER